MKVTPSGKKPFLTPPTPNAPDLESTRFANRNTAVLPDEAFIKILMNLDTTDIAVCRSVNRYWQTSIDARHLLACSFYRDCHLAQRINSLADERNLAVERYHSHIRGWLADFSDMGRKAAEQLNNILGDVHFPEVLFFSIPKLLLNSNGLTYRSTATIGHLGEVRDARFSPDGKYLVTVSDYNLVNQTTLWELEGGQWREKVILKHSTWVTAVRNCFSPDGKYLVIVSNHNAKLWELEGGQWREKVTLRHSSGVVMSASFSSDGNHLVTASGDGTCKIWWLDGDQWQEKVTIKDSDSGWLLVNAQFSPDGKYFVIPSVQGTVKIWKLDDGQWEEKFTIGHPNNVTTACFSPDGKHLVTVASGVTSGDLIFYVKLWELVDHQSQENVTIQHWQEKVTTQHFDIVSNAHFSPDGKYLVTVSYDNTAKLMELEGGQWREKVSIRHSGPVLNASFSRNGKFLTTASRDGTAKICGLVGGEWQEIVTIQHPEAVTNASFGPDDYQLVTVSSDNAARIWVLKNKENDANS